MNEKYQAIPKFDQETEMVVQLVPEVRDDCVYYPCQIVKIPAEQLLEKSAEIIIDEKEQIAKEPVEYKILPVSKIGLTTKALMTEAGFEVVEPVIIKEPIEPIAIKK